MAYGSCQVSGRFEQYLIKQNVLSQQFKLNRIRASVSGWLRDLDGHYPGNAIQAGESICTVSPDGFLIGECYVSSKDIGLLEPGQPVKFQVDAFNYNYFGAVSGSIYSIDKDFTVLEKEPVFRIKCRINQQQLKLSNGFSGELKKGMSFKARFIVCNRTLWQLLTERLDNWLYPVR
jgi:HlyD family secretion protein